MGDLFIGATTKGFTGMTIASASQSTVARINNKELSPALAKLVKALEETSNAEGPTEIVIGVFGKNQTVFTIQVDDLAEIQEILQWTVGR